MMEMGILSWPVAFPDQKALDIWNSSLGETGSKNTDCKGEEINASRRFGFVKKTFESGN